MTSNTVFTTSGIDDRIPSFLSHFYATSDDENGKKHYPDFFTEDASFTFIAVKMSGHEGTIPLLFRPCEMKADVLGMKRLWDIIWEGNIPRQHAVEKVFNCNGQGDGLEIMLYGTVTMNLPKEDVTLDWAGHMTLQEVNGGLRIKDYYVYGVYPFVKELTSGK
jgi:hypothetical protein